MLQIVNKKRLYFVIIITVAVVAGIFWGIIKLIERRNPENQPKVFEALVQITDDKSSDPIEDAKSNLKKGDVIVIFPEGHSWSDTEKNSYLILKLKISQKEADNLLKPKVKKTKAENNSRLRQETILVREYRLKIEELKFDLQKFWENQKQPFSDKVFDDDFIQKK